MSQCLLFDLRMYLPKLHEDTERLLLVELIFFSLFFGASAITMFHNSNVPVYYTIRYGRIGLLRIMDVLYALASGYGGECYNLMG